MTFHSLDISISILIVWKILFSSIMSKKYLGTNRHFCSSGEEQAKQQMCNSRHLSWPHVFALPWGLTRAHATSQWMFQGFPCCVSPLLWSYCSWKRWIFSPGFAHVHKNDELILSCWAKKGGYCKDCCKFSNTNCNNYNSNNINVYYLHETITMKQLKLMFCLKEGKNIP